MAQKKNKNVLDQVLGDGWDPDSATVGEKEAAAEKAVQESGTDAEASAAETAEMENPGGGAAQEKSESDKGSEKDADKKMESEAVADTEPVREARYRIACGTPVNKEIAGILFVRGVGFTQDAFTASWFEEKGYTVTKITG